MSDPNEGEETLVKNPIEPEQVGENTLEAGNNGSKDGPSDEEKKLQRNQSQVRSSLGRSRSDDSLKNDVNLADSIMGEGGQKAEQIPEKKQIPQNFFYSQLQMQEFDVPSESPINQNVAKLDYLYGHDSFKNYNALILDRDTIVYSSGISYTIYNHYTRQKQVFYSRDKGGIGAVAVHPSKKYFAVAEKGVWPNIYIYEFPSLKLYRVIRKGTQRSFSCITFSGSGDMLASVGSDPDFLLTIWDWKQEQMVLKSKAFSQEVYRVNFSQFNEKWITTSGTGHIRFWRIASTFTGMKLKGDIAKFGQIQLSDVASFAQFEDSNVISSSQYGKLLLWEGNLIRSVVSIDQNTPCHKGKIQFVKLVGSRLISAGSDGYIRFWDGPAINTGQSDEKFNLYAKPQKEIYFQATNGGPAHLLWIDMAQDFWIVQDALGRTWKYQPEGDKQTEILRYNSGKFNDFALSPLNNCLITTGQDGVVRLWDYGTQRQFYNMFFPTKAESTCIQWLPFSKKNYGRMVVVGFSDGIVRFLFLNDKGFQLVQAFKVHKNKIIKIKSNREGTIIVVADTAGSLFFISLESPVLSKIVPFCLFQTGFKINDLCWDRNGQKILLACNDGRLHEINTPKQKQCDISETYLKSFESRSYTIKMMESQKPNREELQLELMLKKTKGIEVDQSVLDVEWQPAPILNAIYYDTECSKILCSVDGKYLGFYYIVDFSKERPVSSIQASKARTSFLGFSQSTDSIFIGFRNGSWEMRSKLNASTCLKKKCFDQDYGIVKKVLMNLENSALISASEDGTLLCHKFDFESFKKGVRGDYIEDVQISIPNVILGISEATYSDKIDLGKEIGKDITDNTIYSLQDEKLKAEQDMKMSEAEKVKFKKLKKIKQLQEIFKQIMDTNNKQTDSLAKLTPQQLLVDPEYASQYQKRMDDEEEETRKVLEYDEFYSALAIKKLQQYFVDELEYRKFNVKGIRTNTLVSSFKLKKMSPYIIQELEKIQKIIKEEEELAQKKGDKKNKTSSNFAQSKAILDLKNAQKDQKKGGKQQNQEVMKKIRQAEAEFEKQLAHAKMTKGQYNLKCSPNYVVPQNQRLNVSRKKKHLFLHYQYLFLEKKEFNEKLLKLRHKKSQMIDRLDSINKNLGNINKKLGQEENDIIIEIDEDLETMEIDIEVTDQDIEEHIIQKQKDKDASKKAGGMGMGGGGGEKQDEEGKDEVKKKKKKVAKKVVDEKQGLTLQIKPRPNARVKKSALFNELWEIEQIVLRSQKQKIKSDLQNQIKQFDKELDQLQIIKQNLQSDLTLVEMKILTYAQQFIIFRNMETYDNQLMSKLNICGAEKDKFEDNFIDLTNRIRDIEGVLEELKKKHEEEKKILKEFVYPEDDEMRERILRYYKIRERKRINKLKKQAEQEEREKEKEKKQGQQNEEQEQEEDEESEEQSESDEEDDDEEFEDEDQKPDITVIENDVKNFERVRKICEFDEKIEENQRKKSQLEKERNQITNKIKNLENQLRVAQQKLKVYQKEKLQKVNQLIVSYPVHLSQIEYLRTINETPRIQEDFSTAILFTNNAFDRLSRRIQELKVEKLDIQKKQRALNKKLTKLNESVSKASFEIENKRKQYEEKQLLKFGSTFELDRLKDLSPNDQVLETRQMYKKEERQISRKIQSIKQELQSRKRDLLEAKKQNTKVITEITDLGERENDLKKKLDSTNKQLFKNYDSSKKDELDKERQNLKDLIKFLSKQIEDLKTQIGLFKRKGGHIYTMVTSNKKNFA